MEFNSEELELADDIEGKMSDSDFKKPKYHDLEWWGKVLRKAAHLKLETERVTEAKKKVLEKYKKRIEKLENESENFEIFMKGCLLNSPFKTKEGYKVESPGIGSVSLSDKKTAEYSIADHDYWINQGYKREKTELDLLSLNKYLKNFTPCESHLVDKKTGEIVKGVSVTYKNNLKVRV